MGSALRLSWHVDSADRIVAIEGPWEEVAAAYQAVELTKARVIGTSWREHVADAEIKLLWDALFYQARAGWPVEVSLRCDTPSLAREFGLSLRQQSPTVTVAESKLKWERPRSHTASGHVAPTTTGQCLKICSWCKAVCVPPSRWVDAMQAVNEFRLFDDGVLPQISHGMCPACASRLYGEP